MDTFNQRLRTARQSAGLTLEDVLVAIKTQLPEPMHVSLPTIARLETSTPERKADPFLVQFLCTLYGVDVATVSEPAAEALRTYAQVIDIREKTRQRDTSDVADTGFPCDAYGRSPDLILSAV